MVRQGPRLCLESFAAALLFIAVWSLPESSDPTDVAQLAVLYAAPLIIGARHRFAGAVVFLVASTVLMWLAATVIVPDQWRSDAVRLLPLVGALAVVGALGRVWLAKPEASRD